MSAAKKVFSGVRRTPILFLAGLLGTVGCGNFFIPPTTTTGTSSGSSTVDYLYAINQTSDTLSGFSVGSSALTAVSGSPYALLQNLTPSSIAVSRANSNVYVGGLGAIEQFSIGTSGALTLVNAAAFSSTAKFVSLATSPDGQWLLGLDGLTQNAYVLGINSSTGALSLVATIPYGSSGAGAVVPTQIRISPNGGYVIATLGTGGDALFTFSTSTGALTATGNLAVAAGFTDNSAIFDNTSTYIYIARGGPASGTSGIASYLGSTTGGFSLTGVQTLAVSGNAPFSLLLDSTGSYLYSANRADGTISGFTVASGQLTALAGSPFASGSAVTALAEDNSDKYVIAGAFGGASDLTLYTFDSVTPGKLDQAAVTASGSDPAGVFKVAATH